ncbi:MAG: histidinol phosphate phosphatase [Gemmatimonadetes bacterium]|nr:histidinol phosphate phosphatase [Gemmatimonadota bacterium]
MNESADTLMQAAAEVARIAGATALQYFHTNVAVEWKADGTPVTIADRAAERAARDWIAQRFPDDGILGEEFGEQVGRSGRRWILDPIDGTKSFVRGVPLWGSLVAVAHDDVVLAGAASFPPLSELIAAAPGCGAWCNGVRAHVSTVDTIESATMLVTDDRTPGPAAAHRGWQELHTRAAVSRTWGDCYGYLMVATGRAEVMIDFTLGDWDAACFQPIITEAGGVFTDLVGHPTAFGGNAVATNAALDTAVRTLLRGSTP